MEVEFSDYLDLVDTGAAFVFEARGDRWSFASDLLWMQLGEEFEVPTGTIDAEIDLMLSSSTSKTTSLSLMAHLTAFNSA